MNMKTSSKLGAVTAVVALALTGCSVDSSPAGSTSGSAASSAAPQAFTQELHDALPDKIKTAKKIVAVNNGSFPPYTIVGANGEMDGATADISHAMGELLGVEIEHVTVDGLASVLGGMAANRYDMDLGPVGDFKERQKQGTFVDWVQEFVVFAVRKGNPAGISDLESTCGKKVAVMASGSAEKVIKAHSEKCTAAGNPAIDVQSYKDQPTAILSVQSSRADAFFSSQAPLTYFVEQANGALELTGTGEKNGFSDLFQGAVVPKDSPMADILLKAFNILYENGTYEKIMKDHKLDGNMIDEPGLNLGVS
ncbi:ABC transporter substrate-binding protein [Pseudarthrobacter sp.]|uniref:ABC transporter substrate-binding protein n=1 Tax=Pseudarthrobacter sp. TaxID=1934409 RepID=UPI002FC9FF4F